MDYCAPQWVDFGETLSPQIPMQDYFDKSHTVHNKVDRIKSCDSTETEDTHCDSIDVPCINSASTETEDTHCESNNVPCINKEAQQDLDIIKNTPVKIISLKNRDKTPMMQKTTYDQVLNDAIKKMELCKKSAKTHDAINKSVQDPKGFKTPNVPISKTSKSVGCYNVPTKSITPAAISKSVSLSKNIGIAEKSDGISAHVRTSSVNCCLLKRDETCAKKSDAPKGSDHAVDDFEDNKENYGKSNEEDNKMASGYKSDRSEEKLIDDDKNRKEEKDDNSIVLRDHGMVKKRNRMQFNKSAAVLTWQNGRRSLSNKHRMSNRYVSLAEAVSRFQTETPKRFRTKSNKDFVKGTSHIQQKSMIQNCRVGPTIPVSPALLSRNRTRMANVLTQEEREKLELEEMKKHKIKANPIPPSVLRGPVRPVLKNISRKPITKAATTEAASSTALKQSEKASAITSMQRKHRETSRYDKISTSKNTVTKVLVTDPTGIVVEREEITFFGVPKDTGATKGTTRVVPFSFEARDKNLQLRKEQRLKNLQEASKVKVEFHAKPAPNFSKPSLAMSPTAKQQRQRNMKKPSVQPCPFSFDKRDKDLSKRKEELTKRKLQDKQSRVSCVNSINKRNATLKTKEREVDTTKTAPPLELNTDKRARERREFDERIKRKEMEEETKRQQENKKRLEHEKQLKAELRKQAEVKAKPMPMYKPLATVKPIKPLTDPQSPAFASKLRLKQTNTTQEMLN